MLLTRRGMRSRWLKALDRSLAPMALSAGQVVRSFRRGGTIGETLIVRPGGLGDLVCCCMALEQLTEDPRRFDWLIERRSEPWARQLGLPYRCYDSEGFAILRRLCYRKVVDTEQHFGLSRALSLALTHRQGSVFGFATSRGAREGVELEHYDPYDMHEVMAFAKLFARLLGRQLKPDQALTRRRNAPSSGVRLLGIAGSGSPSRSLSAQQWLQLANLYEPGRSLVILSASADRRLASLVKAMEPERFSLFEGDFDAMCDLLSSAESLLTIDGGMSHIASYYGIPQTVLFTSGRSRKWAPLGIGSRIVKRGDLTCQPCALFGQVPPCRHGYACKDLDQWLRGAGVHASGPVTQPGGRLLPLRSAQLPAAVTRRR